MSDDPINVERVDRFPTSRDVWARIIRGGHLVSRPLFPVWNGAVLVDRDRIAKRSDDEIRGAKSGAILLLQYATATGCLSLVRMPKASGETP